MDPFALPPLAAVLDAAATLLVGIADVLRPLAGTASGALAVVVATLLVRALLLPAGVAQAKAEQARARIAPRLKAIADRHRRDPQRLQRETARAYAEESVSPLAGILPMLAQAPVIGVLSAVFLHPVVAGRPNGLLEEQLAGVSLGANALSAGAEGAIVFAVLVGLLALIAEITRRAFRPPASLEGPAILRQVGLLVHTTALIAPFLPLAAGIYLLTTMSWTLGQRALLRRRYPLP
ncbi:YidC/Oxa1 family membrane protein insertase [Microbacterium sp. JZ70]